MIVKRKYPYFAKQTWRSIFFFNWPVQPQRLSPYIPKPFKLDLYKDKAWMTMVLFRATNSRFRHFPQWTAIPPLTQMNLRTYVYSDESLEKGVYFLSIHLKQLLATFGGKYLFHLPFLYDDIHLEKNRHHVTVCRSGENILNFSYEMGDIVADSLTNFLIERYCIWNVKGNQLIKIPISHPKWTVQKCFTEVTETKLFNELKLPRFTPLIYYCREKHARLYPFETYGYIRHC